MLHKYFIFKPIGKSLENDSMKWSIGKILPFLLLAGEARGLETEDYRNFLYEGIRLSQNCPKKKKREVSPYTPWEEQQVKRSVYSTLQYLGLATSIKALSQYARHFDFTREEHANLGKGLIGNYCTSNLTTMSRTTVKKKWLASYAHPILPLPSREGRPLFQYFKPLFVNEENIKKREFALTVDLFKAFCSWGNDPDDLRLLVPLVRNPAIMAFIFRRLAHTKLEWNEKMGELLYRNDPDASSISCRNLICRHGYQQKLTLGELNKLYCRHFRDVDYKKGEGVPPKIQKIITTVPEVQTQLMASQFVSLLTGVPDFFLYAENFSDLNQFARMPMEELWKKWLTGDKQIIDPKFPYEERLSLDMIRPSPKKPAMKIAFQVNFGEWDRSVHGQGRIKKTIHLNIFNNVLAHAQKIDNRDPQQTIPYLKKMLRHEILQIHARMSLPIPPDRWSETILRELAGLIRQRRDILRFEHSKQTTPLPIEIYYAPFALQHLHRNSPGP